MKRMVALEATAGVAWLSELQILVIASEAKQSIVPHAETWIASSLQRKIALQFCRELLATTR
jgi:hypothetical protein